MQCSFALDEVINYYIKNESTVYVTLLDASKAFDKVRFDMLFGLLSDSSLCPLVTQLIIYMYMHQQCRVKWCNFTSVPFSVQNGVKQGGIASPLMFNLYIDILLQRLRNSGVGCYIGNMYLGSFAYADDIVLVCPTI